ncbi:AAA family ATPase [Coxiella endosymbiont of Ornithodoros maritimus]|uniref:AAA family ATPase n=1 Tax=Coxiella endosymbiont of Ornithodoros maritimus TaxID=1656172 RepID=UPI002263DB5B|nr:AAA family ATPase [Coxiella endosymbiont of Ornithodoros maritimus]
MAKLQDPTAYFSNQMGKLVVLDEIQRMPELFKVLRGIIDQRRQPGMGNGQFLILGSASRDLLRQSSESLAGRIAYLELSRV